jgi:multidrug efflux system membrane fusion protein
VQASVVENAKFQLGYTTIRRRSTAAEEQHREARQSRDRQQHRTRHDRCSCNRLVTFSIPAVHLSTIKTAGGRAVAVGDAAGRNAQAVDGHLTFVDNLIDSTTDTIKLKATFDNKDLRLWPAVPRVSLRFNTLSQRRSCRARPCRSVRTGTPSSS